MKVSLFVLTIGLAVALSLPVDQDDYNGDWTLVPNVDGTFRLVSADEVAFEASLMDRATLDVKFYLYTQNNPSSGEHIGANDVTALRNSHFNKDHPTRIIVHGWLGNEQYDSSTVVRAAYLNLDKYNVFVVDWGSIAKSLNYIKARNYVQPVGEIVASFSDFLSEQGASLDNMYCIGHSLGAHVCGLAGKNVRRGRYNTIFGLDPALPLFDISQPNDRLATGDAVYVQTTNTDSGRLGFQKPIGNASFYPNWGNVQPGCGIDAAGVCSHARSWLYFAESLKRNNEFLALRCGDVNDIEKKKCNGNGSTARMGGDPSNHGVVGLYYLPVNSKEPFATGRV